VRAVLAFAGVGVATPLLIVGELCFRSAKWIADRCCRAQGERPKKREERG